MSTLSYVAIIKSYPVVTLCDFRSRLRCQFFPCHWDNAFSYEEILMRYPCVEFIIHIGNMLPLKACITLFKRHFLTRQNIWTRFLHIRLLKRFKGNKMFKSVVQAVLKCIYLISVFRAEWIYRFSLIAASLKFGHGWLITSHSFKWMWLLVHAIVKLISVSVK